LGKISFVLFFIGFHLTFFIQHFLGLWGMPRRVFTYLPNQGFDMANLISSIGAVFMAAAVIILVINIIVTTAKGEKVGSDPWHDGRTLEWAVSSPPPEYNFKQLPLSEDLILYGSKKGRQAVNDRRGAASGHPYAKRIDLAVHHVTRAVCISVRLYVPDGICLGAACDSLSG
jgi:heme/copper-type cytochrome/quinol oxidase subunit 1